jgi:hypothetical protein
MSYTSTLVLLLHFIYLSYLSNVYRACSFFANSELFCIDNARYLSKNTVFKFSSIWTFLPRMSSYGALLFAYQQ